MKDYATAHEIASDPELYNYTWKTSKFGKYHYECSGYSKSGRTILFYDIVSAPNHKLRMVVRYFKPDQILLNLKG